MLISTGLFRETTELVNPIPRSFPYFWIYFFFNIYNRFITQHVFVIVYNTFIIVYKNEAYFCLQKLKYYFRHIKCNGRHGKQNLTHCDTTV